MTFLRRPSLVNSLIHFLAARLVTSLRAGSEPPLRLQRRDRQLF